MGQGRSRCSGPAESRCAGFGNAECDTPGIPAGERFRRFFAGPGRIEPRERTERGSSRLRHDLPRRDDGRLSSRVAGPDVHAAAAAAAELLRPGDRGGDRASRPDPGRNGASVFAPAQRRGGGDLPQRESRGGSQAHPGRADFPGTGHAAGDRRGRLLSRRGGPIAPRHGGLEAQGRPRAFPAAIDRGHARARVSGELRAPDLQSDIGIWRIWISGMRRRRHARRGCGQRKVGDHR